MLKIFPEIFADSTKVYYICAVLIMAANARRKSKELKENEDDLLFYLEYWKEFPDTFKRVAEKEIAELEDKIKNKKK